LIHITTKKTAPKEAKSPTLIASSVDHTRWKWTEENHRLSV
jgi:hypothetical protein